jgi:hypothetical protein
MNRAGKERGDGENEGAPGVGAILSVIAILHHALHTKQQTPKQ